MTRQELAEEWRERLQDFAAQTNTTVAEWCYYNHVSVHQYYYWKRRLATPSPQASTQPEFLAVEVLKAVPTPPPPLA
jgi:hypothetical protein